MGKMTKVTERLVSYENEGVVCPVTKYMYILSSSFYPKTTWQINVTVYVESSWDVTQTFMSLVQVT